MLDIEALSVLDETIDRINSYSLHDNIRVLPRDNFIFAGGCVRDLLLGQMVRDYDLYITNRYWTHFRNTFSRMDFITEEAWHEYDHPFLVGRYNMQLPMEDGSVRNIDILVVDDQQDVKLIPRTFDIGICKASYSDSDGLNLENSFLKDVILKTLTYHFNTTGPRLTKMMNKFPDYRAERERTLEF